MMIEYIVLLLKQNDFNPGFFRLLNFITFRSLMALATSLLISITFGFKFIIFLYNRRMRDTSRGYTSIDTVSKAGTPTSGGILILFSTLISGLLWAKLTNFYVIMIGIAFIYFAAIGFLDDWQKVRYRSSLLGLSQKMKTILMLLFIIPFAIIYVSEFNPLPQEIKTQLYLPFLKNPVFDLTPIGYAIFISFVIFSIINSINITDGLDGLLSGTSSMTIAVYAIFSYIIGNKLLSEHYLFYYIPELGEITVVLATLLGGILGFLWFNSYPAEIFMGDTGSLSIGAVLAVSSCFIKQEFLFLIAGGIFFIEILSSFIQEKIGNRSGQRYFFRAPLHHSFIHCGIAEPKTVIRFWLISLLLSFIALLTIKLR